LLKDIPVKTVTMYGTPPRTIIDDAQLEHADLILMCSHGRTGLKRLVLGSVAQQVVRQSAIPVLILHEHKEKQSADECDQQPFCILIALDGSAYAETVIQPAAELSALLSYPHPGNLHLIRIIRPILSTNPLDGQTTAQANKEAYDRAGDYLAELTSSIFLTIAPNIPLDVNFSVCCDDDASSRLLSVMAVENLMDRPPLSAIAIATHGRHGIPHWLLGSVTEDILSGTTLPVLLLRHVRDEAEEDQVHTEVSAKKQDAQEPLHSFISS
jgi:nucleotide-binding universal stress UspA family protein